jgi:hypothetical protein
MMRLIAIAAVAAGLSAAIPASAQLMGARELTSAATVKGLPASKPAPDIYYFAGESGAKETFTLTIKGPASLSLFTPDGHEMISATGSGKVTLTAYLNLTDVFTLAVSRLMPGQSYTLSRTATVPTLGESESFSNIGYTFNVGPNGDFAQCWITPGVKYRGKDNWGTAEYTLAADRETISTTVREGSGKTSSYETHYSLAGTLLTRHVRWPTGKTDEHPSQLRIESFANGPAKQWSGYLCAD